MRPDAHSDRIEKIYRLQQGSKPRVVDLFAGAGGLSLGFHTAGFEISAAVEWDALAARTHAINFYRDENKDLINRHAKSRDIRLTEPEELLAEYRIDIDCGIDVIIGGPPCQAFARVGRAKLREVADHPEAFLLDPRSNLYLRFISYVEKLNPLAILMENVPDSLNYGGHNIPQETCDWLAENGYVAKYTILNAAHYGVPQMRQRMILIAYAEELEAAIEFPAPTHWINLPRGYDSSRDVALKSLRNPNGQYSFLQSDYISPPQSTPMFPKAVSARDAIGDLPPIFALDLYNEGKLKKGPQPVLKGIVYLSEPRPRSYDYIMRRWQGFETNETFTGHVIRYLPRDFKIFARLKPGDQYPEAIALAYKLFAEELERRQSQGEVITEGNKEYEALKKNFVPPYSAEKFPNKWRKMEPDLPARTVMAHIGKDSYSHIHYDDRQARTISVREAARIQSFPDGFIFHGSMNAAFRQVGNAVPPLLAYHLACVIKQSLQQEIENITLPPEENVNA